MKKLTRELKRLETHDDVVKASKKLKRHFNRIAEMMIETRKFPPPEGEEKTSVAGEELFAELARIYEIPGGQAAIEALQSEAVRRLDRRSTPL